MLAKRLELFENFIEPANKSKAIWRLLLGVVCLVVMYFILSTVAIAVFVVAKGDLAGNKMMMDMTEGRDPLSVILMLVSFVFMFIALLIAVRLVHKRGISSLIGPSNGTFWRNFMISFAVVIGLSLAGWAVYWFVETPAQNMAFGTWFLWMILAIPLLFLQIASEELIFRGYLQQQLAARFRSRWVWMLLPAITFGALHYQPSVMGQNAWLVVIVTTLFGIIAADVTARTGNLGAAMGLHFANNVFAITIMPLSGTLDGLGLFRTVIGVDDISQLRMMLLIDLALILIVFFIYLRWANRRG
ncbi:MAG: hypothetical protein COB84_00420 [Rhodobacteraceae bacterium]|nr:MAG: hypothetical protein COB84_00420 [Paracoccaceae bacterium]